MHPTIPTLSILSVLSCVARDNNDIVTGYVGHTADIKCPYGEAHKAKSKYLQKGLGDTIDTSKSSKSSSSTSSKLIESVEDEEWTHRGRVSLQDQTNFTTFTVTIHNLTLQDAGVYVCGVQGMFGDISILTVNVKIVPFPTHVATSSTAPGLTTADSHTSSMSAPSVGERVPVPMWLIIVLAGIGLLILTIAAAVAGRTKCKRASSSGNPNEDGHVYSEIQDTSPHLYDTVNQIDRQQDSTIQRPASKSDVYSLTTNPVAVLRTGASSIANQNGQPKDTANQSYSDVTSVYTLVTPPQSSPSNENIYSLASNPIEAGLSSVANENCESKDTPNQSSALVISPLGNNQLEAGVTVDVTS